MRHREGRTWRDVCRRAALIRRRHRRRRQPRNYSARHPSSLLRRASRATHRHRSHEADTNTFSNYLARFAAVNSLGNASGSNTNLFYSFNDGPVHFVGIDTEMWSYGATAQEIAAQKAWLEADLAAVDRSATPWVVGFGHKAYWSECATADSHRGARRRSCSAARGTHARAAHFVPPCAPSPLL